MNTNNNGNRGRKPNQMQALPDDGRQVDEAPPPMPPTADRIPEHAQAGEAHAGALRENDHDPADNREEPRLRTRRRRMTIFDDPFYIPKEDIPPHLSYEWKRVTNVGQEDPFYLAQMREQGWEPVPPSRHPAWVPPGYDQPSIIKQGLMLMDRPKELTEEARAENRQLAMRQVREAEQRLGKAGVGEATRDLPDVRPRIQKEMMRPVMAEE